MMMRKKMNRSAGTAPRVRAYYPNYFADASISMVASRIVMSFNAEGTRADLMGFSSDPSMAKYKRTVAPRDAEHGDGTFLPPIYRDAFDPRIAWPLARRLFSVGRINALSERIFLSGLRKGDVAYLWPGASLGLYRAAKDRGCAVVGERINTLLGTSRDILDAEFRALGISPSHGITEDLIAEELECMSVCDYVFSPSPEVARSIAAAGVPDSKILRSSYGLRKSEVLDGASPRKRRPTALFAGRICVRKGVHLLLSAWKEAAVDARLVIVGRIAPEIEEIFTEALRGMPDVEYREHVSDLTPLYRDADFFVLPSLEEGSPLVTYLALGAGLPSLVSPMGAGGVVEGGREGVVVDPHDSKAFAAAIRCMVEDADARAGMARAARERALEYTWDLVGRRRHELLRARAALR